MSDHRPPSFPPLGDDSRFEAIVTRGRALRRRRQLGVGAGAGGAMVALVLVAVLVTAGAPASSGDPVFADQDDTTASSTTTVSTTTTPDSSETTAVAGAEALQAQVEVADGAGAGAAAPLTVTVEDPARPVAQPDDEPAHLCVSVSISDASGRTAANGHACTTGDSPTGETVMVELTRIEPGGVELLPCAAGAVRLDEAVERSTEPASAAFDLVPPVDLPSGTYSVEVTAVSGIGDGCPGPSADGSTEQETEIPAEPVEFTVP